MRDAPTELDGAEYEAEGITPVTINEWKSFAIATCILQDQAITPTSYMLTSGKGAPPMLIVSVKVGRSGERSPTSIQLHSSWGFWLDREDLYFGENDRSQTTRRPVTQEDLRFLKSYLNAVGPETAGRMKKHIGLGEGF